MSGQDERAAQYAAAFRTGPHMSLEDAREQILVQVMAVADAEQAEKDALTDLDDVVRLRIDNACLWKRAKAMQDERDEALATIARVRALHTSKDNDRGVEWCAQDMYVWPCPTIRALDVPAEPASTSPAATPDGFGDWLGHPQVIAHDPARRARP